MTVNVLPFPSNTTTFTQSGIKPSHNGGFNSCVDLHGRSIPAGVHYVPGPDECTLCVCDAEGGPIWCKAVLCSPPQDCKSFRVGNSCCEFICLDDTISGEKGNGGTTGGPFGPVDIAEVVPKIVIASVCSMLSLALLSFLVYRLRQRHIQGRLNSAEACHSAQMCDECDDTRSLDFSNDCYFERPIGGQSNFFPPHYLAQWKPQSYFPPTSEAPPPYEEIESSHYLPTYNTSSCSNAFNAAAVNSTILTNENINQVQNSGQNIGIIQGSSGAVATTIAAGRTCSTDTATVHNHLESATTNGSGLNEGGAQLLLNGDATAVITEPNLKQQNKASCSTSSSTRSTSKNKEMMTDNSGSPKKGEKVNGETDGQDPLQGPSSLCSNPLNFNRASTSTTIDTPVQTTLTRFCTSEQSPLPIFLTLDNELPPYSVSNFRDCFRHSLTLPRHPRNILELDLDSEYSRRHQQRFSLQFNVADWSSSSSTLSLSTPNIRPESSLSSSTSSSASNSNNTQTTH